MASLSSFYSTEHSQTPAARGFGLSLSTVAALFTGGPPSLRGQSSGSTFQRLRYHLVSFTVWHHCGFAVAAPQPLAEAYGEQAVDDGVQAGVEKPKDEQDVGEGVRDLSLQVIWEEPVPQTQQVVRSPADYEADHYDDAHFQSSHSSFGDVVLWATEMWLIWGHWRKERESGINGQLGCEHAKSLLNSILPFVFNKCITFRSFSDPLIYVLANQTPGSAVNLQFFLVIRLEIWMKILV